MLNKSMPMNTTLNTHLFGLNWLPCIYLKSLKIRESSLYFSYNICVDFIALDGPVMSSTYNSCKNARGSLIFLILITLSS